jgi:hypothetical protein
MNWEPVLTDLSNFPAVADAAVRFSHMSPVLVTFGVECLEAARLRKTALVK